jgi:putative holliday junction resolvase
MSRLIALDYGAKRTGIAETDDLQLIASPLITVNTKELFLFLEDYFSKHKVEIIVLGEPKDLQMRDTNSSELVRKLKVNLNRKFPDKKIALIDERFTSKMALNAMIQAGSKKKDRRIKGNIDKISAAIILQSYMEQFQ